MSQTQRADKAGRPQRHKEVCFASKKENTSKHLVVCWTACDGTVQQQPPTLISVIKRIKLFSCTFACLYLKKKKKEKET